jgi:hypothetical protein
MPGIFKGLSQDEVRADFSENFRTSPFNGDLMNINSARSMALDSTFNAAEPLKQKFLSVCCALYIFFDLQYNSIV